MSPRQAFADHPVKLIAMILVIIGSLNYLSIGLMDKDLVKSTFTDSSKMVYILYGIAGLYLAVHKVMWLSGNSGMLSKSM